MAMMVQLQLFMGARLKADLATNLSATKTPCARFFSPAQRRAQWGRGRALSNCLTCANNMVPWQGERALGAPFPLHPGPFNPLHSHPLHTSSSTVCLGATSREAGRLGDPLRSPTFYCPTGLWENGLDFTLSGILSFFFSSPLIFS